MSILAASQFAGDGVEGNAGTLRSSDPPETQVIAGESIELFSDPGVFRPTLTTSLLTQQVLAAGVRDRTVLDLGCGSGPIAIVLARAGARLVYAADLMHGACALARRNARLNEVNHRISVVQGNLFEPVRDLRFDDIVDDVSGVAAEVARLSTWFPPGVPLAGPDGSDLTIEMLKQAQRHLNPGGRLFFPVLSLSNAARIVAVAQQVYEGRLTRLASRQIPFNQELKEHLEALHELRSRGLIDFEQIRSRLFWTLDIYRADAAN